MTCFMENTEYLAEDSSANTISGVVRSPQNGTGETEYRAAGRTLALEELCLHPHPLCSLFSSLQGSKCPQELPSQNRKTGFKELKTIREG